MPAANLFYQFPENLGKAVHNFTSDSTCTLTLALSSVAPVATNSILANLTQISYTNLSSRVLSGITWEQTLGIASLTANDLILSASGGDVAAFQYFSLYDDDPTSPADPLIMWWDYGAPITILNGQSFLFNVLSGGLGSLAQG